MAKPVRREPRGFDEQWAANAAEIERWRSVNHGKAREAHPVVPQRPRPQQSPARKERPRAHTHDESPVAPQRRNGFAVIIGGLAVGGLFLYLLITLSGIGPPPQFMRQAEAPAQAAPPVDAKRELSGKVSPAPMTLEDRRREEEKRTARAHPGNVVRHAAAALLPATGSPDQKDEAWQRFYRPSESCRATESRGTIACANEYARARMDFEARWAEGKL